MTARPTCAVEAPSARSTAQPRSRWIVTSRNTDPTTSTATANAVAISRSKVAAMMAAPGTSATAADRGKASVPGSAAFRRRASTAALTPGRARTASALAIPAGPPGSAAATARCQVANVVHTVITPS